MSDAATPRQIPGVLRENKQTRWPLKRLVKAQSAAREVHSARPSAGDAARRKTGTKGTLFLDLIIIFEWSSFNGK